MSIEDFIDRVQHQDFANAAPIFNELMAGKIGDALEQAKINIAGDMFNSNDDDDDIELEDLSDDEIGEIIDDEE